MMFDRDLRQGRSWDHTDGICSIGAAVVAAATVGGAVIGASANRKAANTAANVERDTAAQNNALLRELYQKNTQNISPWMTRGNSAAQAEYALLGLAPPPTTQNALGGYYPMGGDQMPSGAPGNALTGTGNSIFGSISNLFSHLTPQQQQQLRAAYPNLQIPAQGAVTTPQPSPYQTAFDNYRNSTGYNFRYNEGMRALNAGFAARGLLNSGAAAKAALRYGQDYSSGEFRSYLGYLDGLSGQGLTGANALAGVSTNYGNAATANNQNAADAAANAALARANGTNSLIGNALSGIGAFAGNRYGTSYGGGGSALSSAGLNMMMNNANLVAAGL